MNTTKRLTLTLCLLLAAGPALAQVGTAFTYQGRLSDAGLPASGMYDFEFKLFEAATEWAQVGSTVTKAAVVVSGGLFTTSLDFGSSAFVGAKRWLEIGVKLPAFDAYTTLTPRQELTPSPNAVFATTAGTATTADTATTAITATTAGIANTVADGAITNAKIGNAEITAPKIGAGQVVKSLNGLADSVTIAGSGGITVSTSGSTVTVAPPPVPPGAVAFGPPGDTTLIDAGYTEVAPALEVWKPTSVGAGVPAGRGYHTAVWTGTRMIVWGGGAAGYLNTGGQYDPVGDSWTATSVVAGVPAGRQLHTAVWTGTRMIVWGGHDGPGLKTGGRYDPVGDTWTATSQFVAGVPDVRDRHTAVWTGTRMIVWGGQPANNTGSQYDPVGDTWAATSVGVGVPYPRYTHTAVWTGTRMIVWGGFGYNTGGQWFALSYFIKN